VRDPEAVARLYYALFNERRFGEAVEMIAPTASFIHRPTRERLIGPAGYRSFVLAWVRAFPDAVVEVTSITLEKTPRKPAEKQRVTAHLIGRGTHVGELDLGGIVFAPTDRHVTLPFSQHFELRDGQILNAQLDFDLEAMRKVLAL
jgi:hypothetical protein